MALLYQDDLESMLLLNCQKYNLSAQSLSITALFYTFAMNFLHCTPDKLIQTVCGK